MPLSIWCIALDTADAYTLSHGRQVLLNRGLQIQSWAFFGDPGVSQNSTGANRWLSANFTTLNVCFAGYTEAGYPAFPSALLNELPTGAQWGRLFGIAYGPALPADEAPYINNFVSYQYSDEPPDILDPGQAG